MVNMLTKYIATSLLFNIGLSVNDQESLKLIEGENLVQYEDENGQTSFETLSLFKLWHYHENTEFQNICPKEYPFLCTFTLDSSQSNDNTDKGFTGCISKQSALLFIDIDLSNKNLKAECIYTLVKFKGPYNRKQKKPSTRERFLGIEEQKNWSKKSRCSIKWIKVRQYISQNNRMKKLRKVNNCCCSMGKCSRISSCMGKCIFCVYFICLPVFGIFIYVTYVMGNSFEDHWFAVRISTVFSCLWTFSSFVLSWVWRIPCVPARMTSFIFWLLYTIFLPTAYFYRKSHFLIVLMTIMLFLIPCNVCCIIMYFENDYPTLEELEDEENWMQRIAF